MKYRDPYTGDFTDLYLKTSDTLPVGTEVDYEGETAPAGWEEVTLPDEVKTIYTGNITATGDYNFTSKSDDYKFIIIELSTGTASNRVYCTIPGPKVIADNSMWILGKADTSELQARITIKSTYLNVLSIGSSTHIRSVIGIL